MPRSLEVQEIARQRIRDSAPAADVDLFLDMLGLTPAKPVDASKCPHCGHKLNLDMRPCRRAHCLRDRGITPTRDKQRPQEVDA